MDLSVKKLGIWPQNIKIAQNSKFYKKIFSQMPIFASSWFYDSVLGQWELLKQKIRDNMQFL